MKRGNIKLTLEDRKCLENVVTSNKSTAFDRLKAEVLLLIDHSEYGAKLTGNKVAEELKISTRSIVRIKEAYVKNCSIQDVFNFPGLSNQSKSDIGGIKSIKNKKKKMIRYVESENEEGGFFLEHVKCRVVLTQDERAVLESIINEGKQTIRKFNRAKILLLADEGCGGPSMNDEEIANKLDVSKCTVQRVRKLFIIKEQVEHVLNFNHQNAGRLRKIDGRVEAVLVAQVCSKPPEGRCRWTLRLLVDRLVELQVVESISHGSISNALKKMNLSLGNAKNG